MTADKPAAPQIVQKRAIDATPLLHGIWCRVGDSELFVNPIVLRRWSEDGREIVVMLDSQNFCFWDPDDLVDIVELPIPRWMSPALFEDARRKDKQAMAKRPAPVDRVRELIEGR